MCEKKKGNHNDTDKITDKKLYQQRMFELELYHYSSCGGGLGRVN